MKYVLYAFLISICVMSSIANGKKYVFEGDSVEVVMGEVEDCDDRDPLLYDSLDPVLFLSCELLIPGGSMSNSFTHPSDFVSSVELDYFCPPPNPVQPVLS